MTCHAAKPGPESKQERGSTLEGGLARAREALRVLLALADISYAEASRRMGEGCDTAHWVLAGRTDLKLRHILALCRVLELDPGEFFAMTYRLPAEPTARLAQVQGLLGPIRTGRPVPKGGQP